MSYLEFEGAERHSKIMKSVILVLIVNLIFIPAGVLCQSDIKQPATDLSAELDSFIRHVMEAAPEIPSIAFVVIKDDKPIFIKAYGLANKETGTKATTETLYYQGSVTKSYTALAAAILDHEGKIKLNEPITKYAPGVTFKPPIPDKITVQNLMTHTSALRNPSLIWRTAFSGQIDDADIMRVFVEGTTFNEQNYGKYAYTNLGYNIYGLLTKISLGKTWQEILQEKVFTPIGLKQTAASVSKARAARLAVADSYLFNPNTGTVTRSPIDKHDNNMQAAGGTVTSISDLGRWLNVHMNNGRIDGKQVIPREVMDRVHTGYVDAVADEPPFAGPAKYGMGWLLAKYRNENVIFHDGGYPGWYNHISYMPDKKFGVAALANEHSVGRRMGQLIAAFAYDRWMGTDTRENYDKQLRELIEQYGRGKQQAIASVRSRAGRTSQLTRPLADYVGQYSNPMHGTMNIVVEKDTLAVRMGYINVVSTPFTEKETIRVELVPAQGDIIRFNINEAGQIDSLTYQGMNFARKGR
jgi:CubicO group peptidase (beta-lactamase class C family)